ncbi:hypothetical protein DAH66_02800 [Sphingomonas koreensis]|uniref:Uncharacterized protein n=1 Tax=Sphingomonas koreensis TaxID=93064 RepID=A0A430G7W3_9SPHN|nr:hypothetical protein [Sphingomonas koreensis]RSY89601.1 hypothetical protein DAH66_02800 [Sphingomonas koreensis]
MATRAIRTMTMTRRRLPLHVASLWLALATALLSSLMPVGMPRTTTLGSAFNPATTAVALQPSRAQPRIVAEAVRPDDEPASGQGDALALAPLPIVPAALDYGFPVPTNPLTAAPALPSSPALDGSPRGPPLS